MTDAQKRDQQKATPRKAGTETDSKPGSSSSPSFSPRGKRRRAQSGSASAGGPATSLLVVIALVVAGLRVFLAIDLQQEPVFRQPVLEDGHYLSQVHQLSDRFEAGPALPQSSFAYAELLRVIPGVRSGDWQPLAIAQSLLDGLTALLLMLWISRRWGALAAGLAGLLYAVDPLGGFFAARLSPLTWCGPLFIGALWAFDARTSWRTGPGGAILFGLLTGFGVLLRPLPFLLLAVLGAISAIRNRRIGWALLALTPALVFTALTLTRNAQLPDGGPVWGWGTGVAVSKSFDPATGGTARWLASPAWRTYDKLAGEVWEEQGGEGTPYDVHRFYLAKGIRHLVERPIQTIGTLLTKAAGTIGAWPIPDDLSPSFAFREHASWARIGDFTFAILFGLGLAGWFAARRSRGTGENRNEHDREKGSVPAASTMATLEVGLLAIALTCLLGPTSAGARQLALPLLAAAGGVWIAGWTGRSAGAFAGARPAPLSVAIALGALVLSMVAGSLSPTAALQNPAEDYRLSAWTFSRQEQWSKALVLLEQARQADPNNQNVRVSLSHAYQRDGLVSAANQELEESLGIDPTHRGTLVAMANLEQTRGNLDKAIETMQRLVETVPRNPLYLNELGQMLMQQGDVPQARALFVQALTIKPDYAVAQRNLEAVETYLRGMENQIFPPSMTLSPADPINRSVPVIVDAMQQGDWATADSLISVAETTLQDHVLPPWLRAAFFMRRGDTNGAITKLEECNRLAPGRPAIVELLIQGYLSASRVEEARTLLEGAIEAARADGDEARVAQFEEIMRQLSESEAQTETGAETQSGAGAETEPGASAPVNDP